MGKLLSHLELAKLFKIPTSYIDELLYAAHLMEREFDHYGFCHHSLTVLGHKFGQYHGTEAYDVGELLGDGDLSGQHVEFDIIIWYRRVIPYLNSLIEKELLDYNCLDEYYQYIGDQQYPSGRTLKAMLEMQRPATMSFHEMMARLKYNHHYKGSDDGLPF